MRHRTATVVALAVVATGCGLLDEPGPQGVTVAAGWGVEVVREDLDGPTQIVASTMDQDTVWVAELAGREDGGAGRVRRLHLGEVAPDAQGDVEPPQLEELLTPTGVVALADGVGERLVAQEQRRLTTVLLDREGRTTGPPTTLGEELPFNGRSQGTLTSTPDGRVLHVSTGTGSGPDAGESGRLSALRSRLDRSDLVAVGFKNAYAHAFDADEDLYVTEIGDGTYDGERPPGELNVIEADTWRGALRGGEPYDGGWPRCIGDADPTTSFGATAEECDALPRPLALFPPGSTPTSVAVTEGGRVLVALWVDGRVVEVDPDSGEVTDVLTDVGNPQHLLALPDGDVLLTVHDRGALWRLRPPGRP